MPRSAWVRAPGRSGTAFAWIRTPTAELGPRMAPGVPPRDDSPRLGELVGRTLKEPLQLFEGEILRPGGDVEPEEDLAAHRVDVAHRVGRADGAGRVRVVDDGR